MMLPDIPAMSNPNVPLMRKILEQIELEPESLDMDSWAFDPNQVLIATQGVACGTTRCIAGWAIQLTGWTPVFTETGYAEYADKGDVRRVIEHAATDELGLDYNQANDLFYLDNNDIGAIRASMEQIAGERL